MVKSPYVDQYALENLPPGELWPELSDTVPARTYPDQLNCAQELLDGAVNTGWGERVLFQGPEKITYNDFLNKVNRIANLLVKRHHLTAGVRVLLRGTNTPMLAALWFAVLKAGGICVTTMPLLRSRELSYIIDKACISLCLTEEQIKQEVVDAQAHAKIAPKIVTYGSLSCEVESGLENSDSTFVNVMTRADDVALIAFTSGTTGKAKATAHFHRDVVAICDLFPISTLKAQADDIFTGSPPLGFTFGLGGLLLFPMRIGASIIYPTKAGSEELVATIAKYNATVCFSSPTGYRAMAEYLAKYKAKSLRKCVSAGEALPVSTYELWLKATGVKLIDGIGATEMLHIFISATEEEGRPGWTGKVIPGYEACIIDTNGRRLPPGEIGLLAVRGPTGCRYLGDAERQKEYVRFGWNITGDAYSMSSDGYFKFQSRADDMIISSGYNISGIEVENVLLTHPLVKECGVIGVPDYERGMVVKAFIVPKEKKESYTELTKELQDFVKAEIAPYKYPRLIEFVDSLPRTETGKLQRFRLRE